MASSVPLKGVSHISISVSNMKKSLTFYQQVFGFEILFDEWMEGPAFEAMAGAPGAKGRAVGGRIGDLRVELFDFNFLRKELPPRGLGLNVLSFEVSDADAAYEAVRRLGYTCRNAPVSLHGTRMFFVEDPDGQGIEMVEYIRGGPAWGGAYR